jgi:UDP-N-acetylglucosamine--N-acetylmuramyl-(pentapeptide) pyrophosphoryl-undecaprenol N-acetylglucosamine transferase
MAQTTALQLNVAIACGGTGGHLFPGVAVAEELLRRGAIVTLMVSPKEIDQLAVKSATGMRVVTLPAVGLTKRRLWSFLKGFLHSYRAARRDFVLSRPQAVLAMGGFTSAPPILAARRCGAATFLHESNTIPGRANRWLSRIVDHAFVGFPETAPRLQARQISVTGTPVRAKFKDLSTTSCRMALGLNPERPVALVMGGSQGARGINDLVLRSLRILAGQASNWQWLHLAGAADVQTIERAYGESNLTAKVFPFCAEMELVMGAATAAVSRAGASSLAELAATRLPAVLVPFPAATDNHQFYNALAFEKTGAARMFQQGASSVDEFARCLVELMCNEEVRGKMQRAMAGWHKPNAAERIAETMLEHLSSLPSIASRISLRSIDPGPGNGASSAHRIQSVEAAFPSCLAGAQRDFSL